jgi:hypothetical protein
MAVPLIMCRLKDDHSTTAKIGETALVYFPDWEPVPMDHLKLIEARDNMTALPEPDPEPGQDEGKKSAGKTPAAKKAAAPAAKDKE